MYQAASGDWCVTVTTYDSSSTYNAGTKKDAMLFILSFAEEDIEWMDDIE